MCVFQSPITNFLFRNSESYKSRIIQSVNKRKKILRNHFLFTPCRKTRYYFVRDLHSLTYVHLSYLRARAWAAPLWIGNWNCCTARAAAAKSDAPLKWKITRARSQIRRGWITAPCSFISYAANADSGQKNHLYSARVMS